jgi:flagellar motor switch protein FliN
MVRYERLSFSFQGQTVFVEALARLAETSPMQPSGTSAENSPAFDPQEKIDQLLKNTTPKPEPPPPKPTADDGPEAVVKSSVNGPETDTGHKEQAESEFDLKNLGVLLDIPLEVSFELGRTKQRIDDLLRLGPGSIVELAKLAGEPVDILVNEKLVARGEVVVEKEKYGVRVTEIINRLERLKSLSMPDT